MKCETYMCLIGLNLPLQEEDDDPKCVLKSLSQILHPQSYRDPIDILQTHTLGGPGVQCKISA